MTSLFIFRRDLRIRDNKGLEFAIKNFNNIIPIFIFTPEQIKNNEYRSENAVQFMVESLNELHKELKSYKSKLHVFHGDNIQILTKIVKKVKVQNIVFNMDYTPYARKRDAEIQKFCETHDIKCHIIEDYLLAPIGSILKSDKTPYLVFTPFKNKGIKLKIDKPSRYNVRHLISKNIENKKHQFVPYKSNAKALHGGRELALGLLRKVKKHTNYNKTRNMLDHQTTRLSAYIKFGCISIREVYWKIKDELGNTDLIGQLFWREFYYYIVYYFAKVLKGQNYNSKYNKINWLWSKKNFDKWCQGKTGYPVVDAGMRQLNQTGYMHNRARLITANFLNRMLGIDWRKGEKYYASMLTDYDPAVNNGNWQWVASTGVDPKPYFQRLFNPWLQSEKYDPEAKYIKKWVPELKKIPAEELHQWDKHYQKYDLQDLNYFKPIVDYKEARERSIKMYKL